VQFFDDLTDPLKTSALKGGCDPRHYLVNGVPGVVERVEFQGSAATGGTGEQCALKSAAPLNSGVRILVLRSAMDEAATPTVTYDPKSRSIGGDPVKDGAANDAIQQVIDTVRNIAPLAPEITKVTRNKGTETATSETAAGKTTYFTRFPGTGDKATEVSFLGSRNGYFVQVLDASGTVLNSSAVTGPATPLDSGEQSIRVPIGTEQIAYARSLRFITTNASKAQINGAPTAFNVVLDTAKPLISTATNDAGTVTVGFNEVISGGTDYASDWFGYVRTASGAIRSYQAETVAVAGNQARKLTVAFPNDGTTFGGVQYRFASAADGGSRYVDRAGNGLADIRTS